MSYRRGQQVLYVPSHIPKKGITTNKKLWGYPNGAQPGFITSGPTDDNSYFVRYFLFDHNTNRFDFTELRTKSGSEKTSARDLIITRFVNPITVWDLLEAIDKGTLK